MVTRDFPDSLFVTGTDTGVGKTLVSALLMMGLEASYWKPVQSGALEGTDTDWIRLKTGLPADRFHPEAYCLEAPLSPHAAAARQGIRIALEAIRAPGPSGGRRLIIEGAGGLLVPLNGEKTMADLILRLGAPVLLVARSGLGTLNHTLLSLEKLARMGVTVWGVVMNGPENPENREAIEHFGGVRVRAQIPPLGEVTGGCLLETFHTCFGVPGITAGAEGRTDSDHG
jgi:dethiobiotin synthase